MLLLLIRTVDAIDLEGPRCASIPNRFFNMIPKKIDEGSRYYRLTEESTIIWSWLIDIFGAIRLKVSSIDVAFCKNVLSMEPCGLPCLRDVTL